MSYFRPTAGFKQTPRWKAKGTQALFQSVENSVEDYPPLPAGIVFSVIYLTPDSCISHPNGNEISALKST